MLAHTYSVFFNLLRAQAEVLCAWRWHLPRVPARFAEHGETGAGSQDLKLEARLLVSSCANSAQSTDSECLLLEIFPRMGAANSVLVGSKRRRSRLGPSLLKLCRAGDADKAAAVRRSSNRSQPRCACQTHAPQARGRVCGIPTFMWVAMEQAKRDILTLVCTTATCNPQVLAASPSAAAYCTLEGLSSLHVCAGQKLTFCCVLFQLLPAQNAAPRVLCIAGGVQSSSFYPSVSLCAAHLLCRLVLQCRAAQTCWSSCSWHCTQQGRASLPRQPAVPSARR